MGIYLYNSKSKACGVALHPLVISLMQISVSVDTSKEISISTTIPTSII